MNPGDKSMSTALQTLTASLAKKLDMGDGADLIQTLKQTAFKGDVSDSQMTALMVVANQYGLNPWTKEIFAFPDSRNGIVPVVGVDGWSRIINDHQAFDGMEFKQDDNSCTCIMYRKDRNHPISVTEYMSECSRGTGPWKTHPMRMLRHKAMIQCARIAFGFSGVYDQDEAERIAEVDMGDVEVVTAEQARLEPDALPDYPDEDLLGKLPEWKTLFSEGKSSPDHVIAMVSAKFTLSDEQKNVIRGEYDANS
jgi:hypothetical protein